jgi:hypothetical protein
MFIYIFETVGRSVLRSSVEEHVRSAGHVVTTEQDRASLFIGMVDSDWSTKTAGKEIMLKTPGKVDSVPGDAILVNVFTLILMGNPELTLSDYLKTVS